MTCMRLGILGNFSIWARQVLANVPLRVWASVKKWSVCIGLQRNCSVEFAFPACLSAMA